MTAERIIAPLLTRGRRVVGALTLVTGEPGRRYTSDDLSWVRAVAAMAAVVIDNARLYDEVEARADATRVLTYVGDGVFLLDRAGVVRLWNPSAETITGLPAATVVGQPAAEVIRGWDQISKRVPIALTREAARAEALPLETERGERWISISGVEFFGGTVYAFRDITESHRLAELQAEFIATASHELRTPLAAVYGAAQTLRRHDFALDEAGRERFISLIVEESDRLGRVVNQILLANQLDVGRVDLETEPFDPSELLERVAEATRTHAPRPHQRRRGRGRRAARRGRQGPDPADRRQPRRERHQVLAGRRPDRARRPRDRRDDRLSRARRGHGHPRQRAPADLREVLPARSGHDPRDRRHRPRALHLQ